eukprot:TRINITY_DN10081_c0_g1_i1.p1 TRINITY_DN10081_c0_g1~~TRINITY_DN10081_c0_g1_i1.p1  ORF type:complete len:213 (+),score=40.69 TRINITY_DN10081_c0_g1_i1:704-1342(+)
MRGHNDVVMCLQFDRSKLITGGDDKTLKIWDMRTGKPVGTISGAHNNLITCLQFDEHRLITGCWSGELSVWDLRLVSSDTRNVAKLVGLNDASGAAGNVTCLQFDSEKILVGSTHHSSMQVWSSRTYTRLPGFPTYGFGVGVTCLQFDASKVINGCRGKEVFVWDFKKRKNRYILNPHSDSVLCLMFDESKIVSGSKDKTIKIWEFAQKGQK